MTKTPEQMAEEYAEFGTQGVPDSIRKQQLMAKDRMAFLAGYQAGYNAAWDEWRAGKLFQNQEHADAVYKEAAEDQLADADKVVNPSNNSNGWISVKERLPPDGAKVLLIVFRDIHYGWIDQSPSDPTEYCLYFSNTYIDKGHHALTHWMPLPEPPGKV